MKKYSCSADILDFIKGQEAIMCTRVGRYGSTWYDYGSTAGTITSFVCQDKKLTYFDFRSNVDADIESYGYTVQRIRYIRTGEKYECEVDE